MLKGRYGSHLSSDKFWGMVYEDSSPNGKELLWFMGGIDSEEKIINMIVHQGIDVLNISRSN